MTIINNQIDIHYIDNQMTSAAFFCAFPPGLRFVAEKSTLAGRSVGGHSPPVVGISPPNGGVLSKGGIPRRCPKKFRFRNYRNYGNLPRMKI